MLITKNERRRKLQETQDKEYLESLERDRKKTLDEEKRLREQEFQILQQTIAAEEEQKRIMEV